MSGLVNAIKKTFKKVTKEIGRAVDKVVDVVEDVVESDVFKVVAVAAVVWFTVGTASAYFAGPTAGSFGASASASATNMWSSTTAFFGGEAAAAGAGESVAALDGMAAEASWGVNAVGGAEAAAANVAASAHPLNAAAVAGSTTASNLTGTAIAGEAGMLGAGSVNAAAGVGEVAATSAGGMMGWLEANPMATMMLGQGVMGAAQGYSADKSAERIQNAEDERLKNRGLGGFDYSGNRQGVVASQQTPEQVVAEPDASKVAPVQQQEVAPQAVQTPVPKDQLPKLLENGQLA